MGLFMQGSAAERINDLRAPGPLIEALYLCCNIKITLRSQKEVVVDGEKISAKTQVIGESRMGCARRELEIVAAALRIESPGYCDTLQ